MLGREVVVISGWVSLGQNALCGNGKIPLGSLGLLTSSIFQVEFGGGSIWRVCYVVKIGVRGTVVGLVWRKIQLPQRNGGATFA